MAGTNSPEPENSKRIQEMLEQALSTARALKLACFALSSSAGQSSVSSGSRPSRTTERFDTTLVAAWAGDDPPEPVWLPSHIDPHDPTSGPVTSMSQTMRTVEGNGSGIMFEGPVRQKKRAT